MRRRRFLALGSGLATTALLAGCTGDESSGSTTTRPSTTDPDADKPDGVYVQSFEDRMSMQGTATVGDYAVALMFTVPHAFWTVTNWELSKTPRTDDDSVHLMAVVWDDDSGAVLPDAGVSVELSDDGSLVSQEDRKSVV